MQHDNQRRRRGRDWARWRLENVGTAVNRLNGAAQPSTDPAFRIRRYRYLWIGELFSAVLFSGMLLWYAIRDRAWGD